LIAVQELEADPFAGFQRWAIHRKQLAPKTVRDYSQWIRCADAWLLDHKGKPLDRASLRNLLEFLDTRRPSPSSRNNCRSALIAYGRYLIDVGARKKNPALRIERVKPKRGVPKPLPAGRIPTLIEVAARRGPMVECLVVLALNTGLRPSEVRLLQWADITGDSASLVQKGGHQRLVYLNARCREILERWQPLCPGSWVFPSGRKKGEALGYEWVRRHMHAIGLEAGIPACRPHRLRHTFGTAHYRQNRDLLLLQEALGHAELANTRVYAGVDNAALKDSLEQLSFSLDR
jgi:integrase